MQVSKLRGTLLILVCVVIYGYSAVNMSRVEVYRIGIDLGRPLSLVWPFETAIVGNMGERGLRIAPKIGRGWRGEAGGEATYKFYIPVDGTYHIWAYALWFDECANAVFAKINDFEKVIIGNDPIYNRWHWIRGFAVDLAKGTHTLTLSNHSDHISLRKVLFTNSDLAEPQDGGPVFSNIFYDGFDGCDRGRFDSWHVVSGEWTVMNPEQQMCLEENTLVGQSEDSSLIIYQNDSWAGYSLSVAANSEVSEYADGLISICFGVKDTTEYHQLKWRYIEGADKVKMEISRKTANHTETLANAEVPWRSGIWHHLEITLNKGNITVKVDNNKPIQTPINYEIKGGIGLSLEGRITAYFDDIHIRQIAKVETDG